MNCPGCNSQPTPLGREDKSFPRYCEKCQVPLTEIAICCRGGEGQRPMDGFSFSPRPVGLKESLPGSLPLPGEKGKHVPLFRFPRVDPHLPQVPIARGHSPPVAFSKDMHASSGNSFSLADEVRYGRGWIGSGMNAKPLDPEIDCLDWENLLAGTEPDGCLEKTGSSLTSGATNATGFTPLTRISRETCA